MSEQKELLQKVSNPGAIVISITPLEVQAQELAATNYIRLLHLIVPGSPDRSQVLLHLYRLQHRLQATRARIERDALADDAVLVMTLPMNEMLVIGTMMEAYLCTVKFASALLPTEVLKPQEVLVHLKEFYKRFLDESTD